MNFEAMEMAAQSEAVPVATTELLQAELNYLKAHPLTGINAEPFGDNLLIWYGLLVGSGSHNTKTKSKFVNLPIRFRLEFTATYPAQLPKLFMETEIRLNQNKEEQIKLQHDKPYVLIPTDGLFQQFKNQFPHWSEFFPKLPVSPGRDFSEVYAILVSLQQLLLGKNQSGEIGLSKTERHFKTMKNSALGFVCPITGHKGSERSSWFPSVKTIDPSSSVNNDDEDQAKLKALVEAADKAPGHDSTIGFIISVSKMEGNSSKISSSFVYSTYKGYKTQLSNNKNSITDKPSPPGMNNYFLPIMHPPTQTWTSIKGDVRKCARKVATASGFTGKSTISSRHMKMFQLCSSLFFELVTRMANNQEIMLSKRELSRRYLQIHAILLAYAQEEPELLVEANQKIEQFQDLMSPEKATFSTRRKSEFWNLNELLIWLSISTKYDWDDICAGFQLETDIRNISWFMYKHQNTTRTRPRPDTSSHLNDGFKMRTYWPKLFETTKGNRNLFLIQLKLLEAIKSPPAPAGSASTLALAPTQFQFNTLRSYLRSITSWNSYFDVIGLQQITDKEREEQLVALFKGIEAYRFRVSRVNKRTGRGRGRVAATAKKNFDKMEHEQLIFSPPWKAEGEARRETSEKWKKKQRLANENKNPSSSARAQQKELAILRNSNPVTRNMATRKKQLLYQRSLQCGYNKKKNYLRRELQDQLKDAQLICLEYDICAFVVVREVRVHNHKLTVPVPVLC